MDEEQGEIKPVEEITRGFWLTAFLILMIIANLVIAVLYFGDHTLMLEAHPKSSSELLYAMGVIAAFNVVMALGIWYWKKWGVFGFGGTAAIAFAINIYLAVNLLGSIVGVILLFLLVRKKWSKFT